MTAISEDFEVRQARWSDICEHLPRLRGEASRPNVTVLELGTRSGNSTAAFLVAAEQNDGHVWSVDIEWAALPEIWYESGHWTFVIGNDLDPVVLENLPDVVDVLFIDTSHHYQQTLDELIAHVPRVSPGGVVLMHDTELDTPAGAPASDPPFPVAEAIRKYTGDHGLTVEWVTGCYGLGVIHIGEAVKR